MQQLYSELLHEVVRSEETELLALFEREKKRVERLERARERREIERRFYEEFLAESGREPEKPWRVTFAEAWNPMMRRWLTYAQLELRSEYGERGSKREALEAADYLLAEALRRWSEPQYVGALVPEKFSAGYRAKVSTDGETFDREIARQATSFRKSGKGAIAQLKSWLRNLFEQGRIPDEATHYYLLHVTHLTLHGAGHRQRSEPK